MSRCHGAPSYPTGIAVAPDGTLYIADTDNNRIRRIADGTITTVAGTGEDGDHGDGGPATNAGLTTPKASPLHPTALSTSPTPATTASAG
jgi:DNA-binding beta-propeller fold protein YncE